MPHPFDPGAPAVTAGVDGRRHDHAAERRNDREDDGAGVTEVAVDRLPLDLEPDEEEEDGHQGVVDPRLQGEVVEVDQLAQLDPQRRGPEVDVALRPGRVGPRDREDRRRQHHEPTGGFVLEQALQGLDHRAGHEPLRLAPGPLDRQAAGHARSSNRARTIAALPDDVEGEPEGRDPPAEPPHHRLDRGGVAAAAGLHVRELECVSGHHPPVATDQELDHRELRVGDRDPRAAEAEEAVLVELRGVRWFGVRRCGPWRGRRCSRSTGGDGLDGPSPARSLTRRPRPSPRCGSAGRGRRRRPRPSRHRSCRSGRRRR